MSSRCLLSWMLRIIGIFWLLHATADAVILHVNDTDSVDRFSRTNDSVLGGVLNPQNQPSITVERLDYKGGFAILELADNLFNIFNQIWQLEDFEVLRQSLKFTSTQLRLITITFTSIPRALILPRTDHVMWALYAIYTRTFILDRQAGADRQVYDWQVSKEGTPFMKVETVPSNSISPDIGEDFGGMILNTTQLGPALTSTTNATLRSDPMTYTVNFSYTPAPLSSNDLLLFIRYFIFQHMRYEPLEFMQPDLRKQKVEFMSEGHESYVGTLSTVIPDPETAQPGEHMVPFVDVVGALRKLLTVAAVRRDARCFKASMQGFTTSGELVPFTELEIRPLVRGAVKVDNATTIEAIS